MSLPMVCGGTDGRVFSPPLRFKPITGEVFTAFKCDNGPFANVTRLTGTRAQKNGKRYERRVQERLSEKFPHFIPGQWFQFRDSSGRRHCQVDGLIFSEGTAVIFEVKYTFVQDAWWQLRRLYEPVVRAALNPSKVFLVNICRVFDPSVSFPESYELLRPQNLGLWRTESPITVIPWRL